MFGKNAVSHEHVLHVQMTARGLLAVGVWRIILVIRLVLNYVMLSSLHLLNIWSAHTISTPQSPKFSSHASICI